MAYSGALGLVHLALVAAFLDAAGVHQVLAVAFRCEEVPPALEACQGVVADHLDLVAYPNVVNYQNLGTSLDAEDHLVLASWMNVVDRQGPVVACLDVVAAHQVALEAFPDAVVHLDVVGHQDVVAHLGVVAHQDVEDHLGVADHPDVVDHQGAEDHQGAVVHQDAVDHQDLEVDVEGHQVLVKASPDVVEVHQVVLEASPGVEVDLLVHEAYQDVVAVADRLALGAYHHAEGPQVQVAFLNAVARLVLRVVYRNVVADHQVLVAFLDAGDLRSLEAYLNVVVHPDSLNAAVHLDLVACLDVVEDLHACPDVAVHQVALEACQDVVVVLQVLEAFLDAGDHLDLVAYQDAEEVLQVLAAYPDVVVHLDPFACLDSSDDLMADPVAFQDVIAVDHEDVLRLVACLDVVAVAYYVPGAFLGSSGVVVLALVPKGQIVKMEAYCGMVDQMVNPYLVDQTWGPYLDVHQVLNLEACCGPFVDPLDTGYVENEVGQGFVSEVPLGLVLVVVALDYFEVKD